MVQDITYHLFDEKNSYSLNNNFIKLNSMSSKICSSGHRSCTTSIYKKQSTIISS